MATPLSPIPSHTLNAKSPSTTTPQSAKASPRSREIEPVADEGDQTIWDDAPSSPFLSDVVDQENRALGPSPSKQRSPSKAHASPVKESIEPPAPASPAPSSPAQTPSKPAEAPSFDILNDDDLMVQETPRPAQETISPSKFYTPAPVVSPSKRPTQAVDEPTLRQNEGLTVAIERMEFNHSQTRVTESSSSSQDADLDPNVDDTCFSTFSEVPNLDMTAFAKIGARCPDMTRTPRGAPTMTPSTARRNLFDRSASPTPRGKQNSAEADTTNLLLDFTQQMESFSTSQYSPSKRSNMSARKESQLLSYIQSHRSPNKAASRGPVTPGKQNQNLLNLLDFELPPAPTPRSIPTITVRELESLKSSYLSQISSLNATLSGKEAEVDSLKKAVNDAERRVGEAHEAVRDEKSAREHVEKEKAEWEKRGKEVEEVLRDIKKEIIRSDKERDELVRKLEESERRAEEAENRAADAETRALEAESKAGDVTEAMISSEGNSAAKFTAEQVQKQLDEKVATLCRELHSVYKKKHETKVAALKKGYEAKAEKKCAELQKQIDELSNRNEELQAHKDATFSGVLPTDISAAASERERQLANENAKRIEEQNAEIEEHKAKMAGLTEEIRIVRVEHTELLNALEQERVEKGELVAAVDEMLSLQQVDASARSEESSNDAACAADELRRSISSRPSGLKGPGFVTESGQGESRIGRLGGGGKGSFGKAAGGGKSRILSNIERMGSGRMH